MEERLYNMEEMRSILDEVLHQVALEKGCEEGIMAKRIKRRAIINGEERWITGNSNEEVFKKYQELTGGSAGKHQTVERYLKEFNENFRKGQESLTVVNREGIIGRHILPMIGGMKVDELTPAIFQKWFDEMAEEYSHESILKIKNILSPALDAAVEDGYLRSNPLKSPRLHIGGRETVHHRAIPKAMMEELRQRMDILPEKPRRMAALLSYEGLRFEEVLGLRWEDIWDGAIHVQRAVVHPKRNLAEVKAPKTKTSLRTVPMLGRTGDILDPPGDGYVVYGKTAEEPMTYTEARRCFEKIRKTFGLDGYSAHDFRDTCATEWREAGVPIDVIARMLGHAKSETTEQRYVKYREDIFEEVKEKMKGV